MDAKGNLYGTTYYGGSALVGVVYKLREDGTLTLFSFTGKNGVDPYSEVIMDAEGNLYGTTRYGGGSTNCVNGGCGLVFRLSKSGIFTVLHRFTGGDDGRVRTRR
jgi:uncharacterized repeat protein (TIGR03803 family)